ncbi:MAG: PadR family transcriptional regulator [Dehalococcoidales bacterium]|nr:PadR family transcriptional regulator [Dehalococcoidales bacterium]
MDEIQEALKKFQKEMNGGTSSLVLLSVLGKAAQPMYGYQIAKLIETGSNDAGIMKQGALYPVLRSMESTGLLESEVEPSVSGPPRRYYRITAAGRTVLQKWTEIWQQAKQFVDTILEGGEEDDK